MKTMVWIVAGGLVIALAGVALGAFFAGALGSMELGGEPLGGMLLARTSRPVAETQRPSSPSEARIIFGGDMMFDRYIRSVIAKKGMDAVVTPGVRELLHSADAAVANLEGPITENPSVSVTSAVGSRENYIFTFPPETPTLLKNAGITHVALGNNHVLNFQADGLESTKRFLAATGLPYFGAPDGSADWHLENMKGTPVAFVGYNEFATGGKERTLAAIKAARESGAVVIVFAHWGKEYEAVLPRVRSLAHEFIDVGADVIIGAHPHIVQEQETYQGKAIYYSLGNFVFDQYFDDRTKEGLLVELIIASDRTLTFREHRLSLTPNGATTLAEKR